MTFEIRTITSDEVEQAELISLQAFGNADRFSPAQAFERARGFYPPDWHLASFEDGEMTSMMRMLPFAMRLNGRGLPFGAVSPVANSPLHRRKGHTGAMLRKSLEIMRERGQWLSGLYTPHPAFYRRYGWEIACDERRYSFKPKDYQPTVQPSQRGRLRWIKPEDWSQLDRIYRQHSTLRNGPFHRGEVWWRNSVMGQIATPPGEAVIWETDAGEPQGYAVILQPTTGQDAGQVWTREFAALTSDAYLNLLAYLASHDIHSEIVVNAPSDDPLQLLFADTERLTVRQSYTVLLRLVDVEAALRARPLAAPDIEADFTIAVSDASAPWNEGAYHVRAMEGAVEVERVGGDAALSIDARFLAPVYNGYITPPAAAAAGLLRSSNSDALLQAEAFFAVTHKPYFPDRF